VFHTGIMAELDEQPVLDARINPLMVLSPFRVFRGSACL